MNQSYYYITTDKVIKNIFIFTLNTNFINCATRSDNINTQINSTSNNVSEFSSELNECLFTDSDDDPKYTFLYFLRTLYNSDVNLNKDSDTKSSNSSIMDHSGIDSNDLQSTECTQGTSSLPYASNNFIVLSDDQNYNLAISSDHSYCKNQDEDKEKMFDFYNNVKKGIADPSSQTDQTSDDTITKNHYGDLLVDEFNALITGLGTFINLENLFSLIKVKKRQYTYYFGERYCNIKKIHNFLKIRCSAELNFNKGVHTIKFDQCSFGALEWLKSDFINDFENKENFVVRHNFAVLCHLFKFHPKIAFIIIKYLRCEITESHINNFRIHLSQYVYESKLSINYFIAGDHDKIKIASIVNGIQRLEKISLNNLLNFTNLFLGLLRLYYYNKIPTDKEKSNCIDYLLSNGNVKISENFGYLYNLPWVYSTETDSNNKDTHSDVEKKFNKKIT